MCSNVLTTLTMIENARERAQPLGQTESEQDHPTVRRARTGGANERCCSSGTCLQPVSCLPVQAETFSDLALN
ncbi:hypothetical protein Mal64_31210 [Pseudobythopirellula maris]|uniref:Uncharacterized protein n=1 Tax=Pseudobythopirellula maris TaxID=2527991 RepID=A0A5C5ZJM7_9BACT|nr:hypothetical protein Mal64_31210 [Pseudobythopirellula maris]